MNAISIHIEDQKPIDDADLDFDLEAAAEELRSIEMPSLAAAIDRARALLAAPKAPESGVFTHADAVEFAGWRDDQLKADRE